MDRSRLVQTSTAHCGTNHDGPKKAMVHGLMRDYYASNEGSRAATFSNLIVAIDVDSRHINLVGDILESRVGVTFATYLSIYRITYVERLNVNIVREQI